MRNIQYLDYIDAIPDSKFITHPKYNCMGIKYKNIENAIRFSNKHKEIGYFTIGIIYEKNEEFKLPDDISFKEAINLRKYGWSRIVYIASDLSQVYAEWLCIDHMTIYYDYGYIFGNKKCYPVGTEVICSLPFARDNPRYITEPFGYDLSLSGSKEQCWMKTREEIMNQSAKDHVFLLYTGDKVDFEHIYPLATLKPAKQLKDYTIF